MGKKGGKRHLKRRSAPESWHVHRKEAVWTVKPNAGSHAILNCVPLITLLRDILGVAKTRHEAKTIIHDGKIMVDGKVHREELFPAGLMDVVSISDVNERYRVLPYKKGLFLHPISEEEASFKLCRIDNKTVLKKGYVQLNLHDGRNVLIRVENTSKPEEDFLKTLDTIKLTIPNQEIVNHIKLNEGASAIIVGGKNIGKYGNMISFEKKQGQKRENLLSTIEDKNGNRFQTTMEHVFVIGGTKPQISLPEAI